MKAWETTFRKTHAVAKKRANSIFGTTHVAHAEDEEEVEEDRDRDGGESHGSGRGTGEADRVLANGDRYTGHWSDNLPHGSYGRYVWSDGCVYVGEWFKGKMTGRGRFSWPSGAFYEGEFKGGYMHGRGIYRGSNGETHKGSWMMNLKHGHGVKEYANGDSYEGDWCRGLQEGVGKYQWKDGNQYVGEWKNGAFHGKGKLVWSNGNVFDGHWEDGLPKGNGTYRWCDGSFYVGNWSKDPKEQNGTYYPSGTSPEGNLEWDHQEVFNIDLRDCKVCPGEKISMLPSQKKIGASRSLSKSVDNAGVAPRRMSVDVVAEREFSRMRMLEGSGSASCDGLGRNVGGSVDEARPHDVNHSRGNAIRIPKVARRQGETISRGHRNYELMLNLQLGIRHSVGRPGPPASLNLKSSAFDPKEKVWTKFPPEGSKHTPPHQSCEFKWKDYCPLVFKTLRMLFKVDAADYMLSICGNDALRELSSPGKSGSFFYLTNDDRYMIKTMKKAEAKVLIRMLSAYYNHVRAFENTLVTKFYGLHCVKLHGPSQKKVRFIIMGNLFCSQYAIHRRFDLKGSSLGRMTDKAEADIDPTTILKDLDLNFVFRLQRTWFQEFRRQIDKDCEFLEQERIMDYSLLVGLHFRETTNSGELIQSNAHTPIENGDTDAESMPRLSRADMDQLLLDPAGWASIRLGVNMPARVERTVRKADCESQLVGQPTGECYDVVMFFGVIDILQDYDITKKLEHAYKSIHYDPTSISAVDPKLYARRFREFILKIFTEDT